MTGQRAPADRGKGGPRLPRARSGCPQGPHPASPR